MMWNNIKQSVSEGLKEGIRGSVRGLCLLVPLALGWFLIISPALKQLGFK